MQNWWHDLLLYFGAVSNHLFPLLTGGVLMALVWVYEHRKNRNLSWQSCVFIVVAFGLYSMFAAWQDEHRNTYQVVEDKSSLASGLGNCNSDLKIAKASILDKESLVTSLQTGMTNLQGPQAQQAANIATCINSLAKMNPAVARLIRVSEIVGSTLETPISRFSSKKEYFLALAISTNEPTNASGVIECNKKFVARGVKLNAIRSGMSQDDPITKISDTKYHIRIIGDANPWISTNPVLLAASSDYDSIMPCTFTLDGAE